MATEERKAYLRQYQLEWMNRRRAAWFESQGGRCVKCGSTEQLEVDHIDPILKVSHAVWSWSDARREDELAKCQPLCHDCHLIKTSADRMPPLIHGTSGAFRHHKCRCKECRAWKARDTRKYRAPK